MKLIPLQPQPNTNAIAILEKLLAKAKAGEITHIVYATISNPEHTPAIGYNYDTPDDWWRLLAAVSYLHHRLIVISEEDDD